MGNRPREIKARSGRWWLPKRWRRDAFAFFDPTTSSQNLRQIRLETLHLAGAHQLSTLPPSAALHAGLWGRPQHPDGDGDALGEEQLIQFRVYEIEDGE